MCKTRGALIAFAVALAWSGEVSAATVELLQAGNDPTPAGWCNQDNNVLPRGTTMFVTFLGRAPGLPSLPPLLPGPWGQPGIQWGQPGIQGHIRMKTQTDTFEWAYLSEPAVTFTGDGSSPTTFPITAKASAPLGTHLIEFAAVDNVNLESSHRGCKILVVSWSLPYGLAVAPPSGATEDTPVIFRPTQAWAPSEKVCGYEARPTGGGVAWASASDPACAGATTRLAPGTYTLRLNIGYRSPEGSSVFSSVERHRFVVAARAAPPASLPQAPTTSRSCDCPPPPCPRCPPPPCFKCTIDADCTFGYFCCDGHCLAK